MVRSEHEEVNLSHLLTKSVFQSFFASRRGNTIHSLCSSSCGGFMYVTYTHWWVAYIWLVSLEGESFLKQSYLDVSTVGLFFSQQ